MLKYITHNDYDICTDHTHKQGNLDADYSLLCKLFGQPFDGDGYKVDAEWMIEFDDGTIATIHNWKDGRNYCGAEGLPTQQIRIWSVGGHDIRALNLIKDMVENAHRITVVQGHVDSSPTTGEDIAWQTTVSNH